MSDGCKARSRESELYAFGVLPRERFVPAHAKTVSNVGQPERGRRHS